MAQIVELGKLRFNWKGTDTGSVEYSYKDVVKYGPNLYAYKAAAATIGNAPCDTSLF